MEITVTLDGKTVLLEGRVRTVMVCLPVAIREERKCEPR